MDCILWKTILLNWTNQTGFFNRVYDNLGDTDIDVFFMNFKEKITSQFTHDNINLFMKDKYPGFQFTKIDSNLNGNNNNQTADNISKDDYVFMYSLLLHYACVLKPDPHMQHICEAMTDKYQAVVAKFFNSMHNAQYTRVSIQTAIEEAENSATSLFDMSPLNRSNVFSIDSPPTPRTKLLDNYNKDNRMLKAELESERVEKTYQEMELKMKTEQIKKLEIKYRESQNQIIDLRKNIQMMEDNKTPHKLTGNEQIIKRLKKELMDKESRLTDLESVTSSLDDQIKLLEEKLNFSHNQLKTVMNENAELSERIEMQKAEIEDTNIINKGLSTNNRELDEIVKDLRSQLNKSGHDLSFDLLNGSSSETSQSGNFSFAMPENLANAVVDVRLFDQQKQNQALTQQLERIRSELNSFQTEHANLLKSAVELKETESSAIEQSTMYFDSDDISTELRRLNTAFAEQNQKYITELAVQKSNFDKLDKTKSILQEKFDDICAKCNKLKDEVAALEQQLAMSSSEKENLKRQIEQSEKSLNEERRDWGDQLMKFKKEIDQKSIDITDLRNKKNAQIEKLQCDLRTREVQQQKLDDDLKLMDKRIKDALTITENQNHNIDKLQTQKELLMAEMAEVKEQARILHEHHAAASSELFKLKLDYNTLSNEKQSIDEKYQQLSQQEVQRDSKFKEILDQLEKVNHAFLEKEKECDVARVEVDTAKQQLKEMEIAQQAHLQKLREFQFMEENLNETAKRLEKEMQETQHQNQLYKNELETVKSNSFDLMQKNESLECELQKVTEDLLQITDGQQSLKEETKKLETNYVEQTKELQTIKSLKDELNTKLAEIESTKQELTAASDIVRAQLRSSKQEYTDLVEKYSLLKSNLHTTSANLQVSVAQINVLQKEKSQLHDEKKKLEKKFIASQSEIKNLQNELEHKNVMTDANQAELQRSLDTLTINLNEAQLKCLKMADDISLLQTEIADQKQTNVQLIAENSTLLDSQMKQKSCLESAAREKKVLIEELTRLQDDKKTLEKHFTASQSENKNLQNEFENTQTMTDANQAELQGSLDTFKNNLNEAQLKCSKLTDDISLLQTEIADQKQTNVQLTAENSTLLDSQLKQKSCLETAASEKKVLEEELSRLQEDKKTLEKHLTASQSEIKNLQNEFENKQTMTDANQAELQGSLDTFNNNLNEAQLKCSKLTDDISLLETEIADQKQTNVQLTAENSTLLDSQLKQESHLQTATRERNILQEEKSQLQDEKKKLEEKFIASQSEIKNLQAELENMKAMADANQAELQKSLDTIKIKSNEAQLKCDDISLLQTTISDQKQTIVQLTAANSALLENQFQQELSNNMQLEEIQLFKDKLETIQDKAANQKTDYDNQITSSLSDFEKVEMENKNLTELVSALNDEKSTHHQQIVQLKSEIEKLTTELTATVSKYEISTREMNQAQDTIRKLQLENEGLTVGIENKVNEQNRNNGETEARHRQEYQDMLNDYQLIEKQMHEQRQQSIEEASNLQNRIHEQETQRKMVTANLVEISETLKLVRRENGELKNDIKEITERATAHESQASFLQNDKVKLESHIVTLRKENEELLAEIAKLAEKCENNVKDLEVRQNESASIEKRLQAESSVLSNEREQFALKLNDLTQQIEGLENAKLSIEQIYQQEKENNLQESKKVHQEIMELKKNLQNSQDEMKLAKEEIERKKNELLTRSSSSKADTDLIQNLKAKVANLTEGRGQDVSVLRAKLTKTREQLENKEKAGADDKKRLQEALTHSRNADELIRENRQQNEEKLEKMKEKMKTLYNEEMGKVKIKHEKECSEIKSELQKQATFIKNLSAELYVVNEKHLEVQKENEFMKSKIRILENHPSSAFSGRPSLPFNTKLMGRIPSCNFKMEDEESEIFNNTYLDELKTGGRFSPTRDSVTHDELTRRNSMYPMHLRSSYAPQYADQNLNEDDLIRPKMGKITMDDSMLSVQSDGRRGTLYKRPGPPTPSKNGGRLSIGGELPKGEILREHNQNDVGGGGGNKQSGKKNTPGTGKRRSLFSTSKLTETLNPTMNLDQMDIDHLTGPITSTPRHSRQINSPIFISNCISSLFGSKFSVCDVPSTITEQSIDIEKSNDETDTTDSNSNNSCVRENLNNCVAQTITNTRRKSMSRRKSINRQKQQSRIRREQRNLAYSRSRKIDEQIRKSMHRRNSQRFNAILNVTKSNNAQMSLGNLPVVFAGKTSFGEPSVDFNQNFEHFIMQKSSQHPYIIPTRTIVQSKESNRSSSTSTITNSSKDQSDNQTATASGQSMNSTTTSNHRTGIYLNSHKIPHVVRYESRRKLSIDADDCMGDVSQIDKTFVANLLRFWLTKTSLFCACIVCVVAVCFYNYLFTF